MKMSSIYYRMINAHVADSNRKVIKMIYKKMDKKAHTFKNREARKQVYRIVLENHKAAQDLFNHYRF